MIYGDIERFLADLYPWRWPIIVGAIIVFAAFLAFAYRKGWHLIIQRHWRLTTAIAAPTLALAIFGAWMLAAPLFTNVTVEEEFPFALAAEVPADMTMAQVEDIMAGMAMVNQEMDEPAPKMILGAVEWNLVDDPTPVIELSSTEEEMSDPEHTPVPAQDPTPTPQAVAVKLKAGMFKDADSFHKGSGEATIFRGPDGSLLLRLEDFNVTNGPDLHVLLSPHPDPERQGDVKQAGYVDLGKLKGNIGNQNYPIPDDVDVSIQGSVVIYCKPFHVVFSVATLEVGP